MSELQNHLKALLQRLDRMGMRVEKAVREAIRAARTGDTDLGQSLADADSFIDREEVQIEQECIRLLALYQPAAIDLRTICTVIKANSDLERIADLAASIAKRVKHMVSEQIWFGEYAYLNELAQALLAQVGRTVRMLGGMDATAAAEVIHRDCEVDRLYRRFIRSVLDHDVNRAGGAEVTMTLVQLAKAMERIGDHCTNVAEDVIFLRTGDIVRHAGVMGESAD
jgi:phosphate transport system protein